MSWSLRAMTGNDNNPFGGSPPKKRKQPSIWDDEGAERAGRAISKGVKDTERFAKNAYHTGKDLYHGGQEAKGLIKAGIKRIKGKDAGYKVVHSDSKRGQEFTETYRSYGHAKRAMQELKRKGRHGRIEF